MIDNNNLNETSEIDDFSFSSTNQRNCITIEGLEKIGRNEFCRAFFDQITSRLFTANSNSPEFRFACEGLGRNLENSQLFESIKFDIQPGVKGSCKNSKNVVITVCEKKNSAHISAMHENNRFDFLYGLNHYYFGNLPLIVNLHAKISSDKSGELSFMARHPSKLGSMSNYRISCLGNNSNPHFTSRDLIIEHVNHQSRENEYTEILEKAQESLFETSLYGLVTIKSGFSPKYTKRINTLNDSVFPSRGYMMEQTIEPSLNIYTSMMRQEAALNLRYDSKYQIARHLKFFDLHLNILNGFVVTSADKLPIFEKLYLNDRHKIHGIKPFHMMLTQSNYLEYYFTTNTNIYFKFPIFMRKIFPFMNHGNSRLVIRNTFGILSNSSFESKYFDTISFGLCFKLLRTTKIGFFFSKVFGTNMNLMDCQNGFSFSIENC